MMSGSSSSRAALSSLMRLLYNYPLQLSGAMFKEVITFRPLQVQQQSALSRAFESTACS
jgi:hypothetical protein